MEPTQWKWIEEERGGGVGGGEEREIEKERALVI
jgi:hypothetical protein